MPLEKDDFYIASMQGGGVTITTYRAPHPSNPRGPGKSKHIDLTQAQLLDAAWYLLTNSDLRQDDPRRLFVAAVRSLTEGPGWNEGRIRLIGPASGWDTPEIPTGGRVV